MGHLQQYMTPVAGDTAWSLQLNRLLLNADQSSRAGDKAASVVAINAIFEHIQWEQPQAAWPECSFSSAE